MNLTILIPTYNRSNDLIYNLHMLEDYIRRQSFVETISILVSNNCSSDNTKEILEEFNMKSFLHLAVYHQTQNIGPEKNDLFCLEHATSDYVMYLGDDDFLDERYLVEVVKSINNIPELTCIIPSFVGILPNKEILPNCSRDIGLVSCLYEKGFHSCLINSIRGHQLSGLTFKRKGLLAAYRNANVSNIYPFIYFVCYSSLNGRAYHITEFPVKVTQLVQDKKDWGYGADGLISEIFDNFKKLRVNILYRFLLEFQIIKKQPFRYLRYYSNGNYTKLICSMWKISYGENSSIFASAVFPLYFLCVLMKIIIKEFFVKHTHIKKN